MAVYIRDFMGIPAWFNRRGGLDPNYGDHYRGMRMKRDDRRAAYGSHRMARQQDLGTAGGFYGHSSPAEGQPWPGEFDPRWELTGSAHGSMKDPNLLRHYNANSPALSESARGDRDAEAGDRLLSEPDWMPERDYDPSYSNRGISESGYSDGGKSGPMRGAR